MVDKVIKVKDVEGKIKIRELEINKLVEQLKKTMELENDLKKAILEKRGGLEDLKSLVKSGEVIKPVDGEEQ